VQTFDDPPILLGTSSFTASGWDGVFYPKGMRSADYLAFYAEHFHTVEVDSTFYGCPSARTVNNWGARTPEGFIFSVKAPQVITHEKVLVDCDADLKEFVDTMSIVLPQNSMRTESSAIPCRDGCPIQVILSPSSAKNLSRKNAGAVYLPI
jgi:Protein of unknown function DUF72